MVKRTIPPITAVLLSVIGFAAGLHLQSLLKSDTLAVAKGCFSFGLWQLMEGKPYALCCLFVFLSVLFHACLLLCGTLSWISFPAVPAALFGIGFKVGVAFAFLSPCGVWETVWLVAFCLPVLFASCALACREWERRLYHLKLRPDNSDRAFLQRVLLGCAALIAILCLFLLPAVLLPCGFYALFDTLL